MKTLGQIVLCPLNMTQTNHIQRLSSQILFYAVRFWSRASNALQIPNKTTPFSLPLSKSLRPNSIYKMVQSNQWRSQRFVFGHAILRERRRREANAI